MIDEFERSAIPFKGELPTVIKNNIKVQLGRLQGQSVENLEGYQRAQFLLGAQSLTGNELKQLQHYIDSLPRNQQGEVTDPAYAMVGGDSLHTFVKQETKLLRDRINKADANKEELGQPDTEDVKPLPITPPKNLSGLSKLSGLDLNLTEEIKRIKQLIRN